MGFVPAHGRWVRVCRHKGARRHGATQAPSLSTHLPTHQPTYTTHLLVQLHNFPTSAHYPPALLDPCAFGPTPPPSRAVAAIARSTLSGNMTRWRRPVNGTGCRARRASTHAAPPKKVIVNQVIIGKVRSARPVSFPGFSLG